MCVHACVSWMVNSLHHLSASGGNERVVAEWISSAKTAYSAQVGNFSLVVYKEELSCIAKLAEMDLQVIHTPIHS